MDDHALLAQFFASKNAKAFDELARRYEPLIHAAALRQVVDTHLAQDITQSTMMALMKKAGKIPHTKPLGPWLLRVTHYLSIDALRSESVRRRHERLASRNRPELQKSPASSPWPSVEPILDQCLHALRDNDRTILILRYLQSWTIEQVAGELRLTPDATRQRLSRALRRLRNLMAQRGIREDDLMPVIPFTLAIHRFCEKLKQAARGKLFPFSALAAITALAIVAGGFVLVRAEMRRTPVNSPSASTSVARTPAVSQLPDARPNSTIP